MTRKARPNSKAEILTAAVKLMKSKGGFSRLEVAQAVGVAEATISFHFGTMEEFRSAVASSLRAELRQAR